MRMPLNLDRYAAGEASYHNGGSLQGVYAVMNAAYIQSQDKDFKASQKDEADAFSYFLGFMNGAISDIRRNAASGRKA